MEKYWKDPDVVCHGIPSGELWTFKGDWCRDVPLDIRWEVGKKLESFYLPTTLIVDLSRINAVDGWGENYLTSILRELQRKTALTWVGGSNEDSFKHFLEDLNIRLCSSVAEALS